MFRGQEHGIQIRIDLVVDQSHLELVLKIRTGAQAFHDDATIPALVRAGRTIEEARDYLVNCFKTFTPDMSDMMQEAFDNEWIDFFPRKGKQFKTKKATQLSGAFVLLSFY